MYLRGTTYEEVSRTFAWNLPERFNIATAICDRHVGAECEALIFLRADGAVERYTFERLQELSKRFANALAAHGIGRGDRVAILLSQSPETAITHLAAYRLGAIAVPLFSLFGPDAIEYRLANSGAKLIVTHDEGLAKLAELRERLPDLATIVTIDGARGPGTVGFHDLVARASDAHETAETAPDDPAFLLYTSGTTANPKGVLHGHRGLIGILPGIELTHNLLPQPGDRMWTPADWAWAGGLLTVLLPGLYYGLPVVAHRFAKFDPEVALDLMNRHAVRNIFMPPTALRMLRSVAPEGSGRRCDLRSIASGGERLGAEMLDWSEEILGTRINEYYGLTEINICVGNSAALGAARAGSMGRAIPGHVAAILDEAGHALPDNERGILAFRRPDPVMFLRYWNDPARTEAKHRGAWCLTGDMCHRDEDGYLWFHGRDDDVIISSGYTIGPDEVEACLMRHPAVGSVAVVGVPDAVRGQIVKAFVIPAPGHAPGPDLAAEIQAFVKTKLSPHEYPRAIEFRESLPMTITGKIRRRDLREGG